MVAVVRFHCCLGMIHDQGAALNDWIIFVSDKNFDINSVV